MFMSIIFNNGLLICSVVLVFVLFTGLSSQAGSDVKVEPIDEAALNQLMTAGGEYLVLSFMAAWCGPCIAELPALNKLYQRYKNRGLQILGVSIDLEGPTAMQPILKKLKIKFPVYWYGEKAIEKFKLDTIPMLLFIKQGKTVERLHGQRPEKFLNQKFREFLK
jgi:thiol-disulfide isomerase/thioredoxin